MSLISRFPITIRGAITFTGNTLGLSQLQNANQPGTQGSIGAFISAGLATSYNKFPIGTTSDYTLNKSEAFLRLPPGSIVLYAELIWGGNAKTNTYSVVSKLDDPIRFTTPSGSTYELSPASATKFIGTAVSSTQYPDKVKYYMRSAVVTTIIQSEGPGKYAVGKVPALLDPLVASTDETNFAGWTLAVIYQNLSLPLRNMTLYVGGDIISLSGNSQVDISVSNFSTPSAGSVNSRILISAGEGDAQISGDQALFAPTTALLTGRNLSGIRNPSTQFFSSQITDDAGNLDTTGTFGTLNHNITTTPVTLVQNARQGWDITNLNASNYMTNNQQSAVLRLTTTGDAYMPVAVGIQIDVLDIQLNLTKSATPTLVSLGNRITYTLTLTNPGLIPATNVKIVDPLVQGLTFIPNSVFLNGVALANANITQGITISTVAGGSSITLTFSALANEDGINYQYNNTATVEYTFIPAPNLGALTDKKQSNTVTVYQNKLGIKKSLSPSIGITGDELTCTLLITSYIASSSNIVSDVLPPNLQLVNNLITIDNQSPIVGNILTGVELGAMISGQIKEVKFLVKII